MGAQADVIFTGGPGSTPDPSGRRLVPAGPPPQAVAVRGDRIIAVGDPAGPGFQDLTGPRTEVSDLRGRALLPGFQDAHVHPAWAGVTMIGCNLIGTATRNEGLARISAHVASHADREWIAGSGWRMDWFDHGTPS